MKYIIITIIFIFIYKLFFKKKKKVYEKVSDYPILETPIYHIGLAKCGTTSTANMFGKHIFATHDYKELELLGHLYRYLNKEIDIYTVAKYLKERENINGKIIQFDSTGQYIIFYKELYKLNPNAKYIFTFRNMYDWMNSAFNYQLNRCEKHCDTEEFRLYLRLEYNMWNIMLKKIGHIHENHRLSNLNKKNANIMDFIHNFWNKRIDSIVAIQCHIVTEFLNFAKNKKNIIIIPLKKLSSKKTLKKLGIFTGVKGLTKSHSNKNEAYKKTLNKRKFIKSFTTYKTPEIIELYKKYNLNN